MKKATTFKGKMMVLLLVLVSCTVGAQDVEKLFDKENKILSGDPFKINGSVGLNLRSYNASGIDNRQSPFTWYLHSNLNISIYQINIPFSALISAQSQTFSHPFHREAIEDRFTRIGASPYYKWVQLHAGHRNMTFSPLTVAGHTYLGGGIELTPGNFRFGAFYGKLAKTEPQDLSLQEPNTEVFKRTGFGTKIGYGTDNTFIDFILFKAKDDDAELGFINADTTAIFQNENVVLGINGKATLLKRVDFNLEVASSAFTKNSTEETAGNNEFPHPSFLIQPKPSTSFRWAVDSRINYRLERFTVGLGYKRIEPEYKSLGAYFFNNDIENYTANIAFPIFKKRISITANGGLQRNNLFNQNATQLNRKIAAVNLNYSYKAFSLGANFSNYTSDIDFVLNADLDSLNAVVITQQAGLNAAYTLVSKNSNRHTFSTQLMASQITDDIDNAFNSASSQMYNGNLLYAFIPQDKIWKIRAKLNYNQNELSSMTINRYGFGLGVTRQLIEDKWAVSIDANYFNSQGEAIDNQTIRVRISSPITIAEKHRIDLGILALNRTGNGLNSKTFREITAMAAYVFTF